MEDKILNVINGKTNYCLLTGSSLDVLKKVPSNSIDCVITSPPYWLLRDYDIADEDGEQTKVIGDEKNPLDYVKKLVEVFDEVYRILTKEGSLWLNLGDKYYNKQLMGMPWRVALAMMDKGWILRNDVIWDQMKGTQSAKDRLRDVYEHIFHFVKSKKYYYAHKEIRVQPKRKPKMYNGEMISATGVSGKKYKKQILESIVLTEEERVNALNALNETLEELLQGRIIDFRMTIKGEQRTFHSDKTNISGRAKELATKGYYILKMGSGGHLPSDIWRIAPEDVWRKDAHYAVFPEELLLNPIKATCPENGIVLDPFSGTGSTVVLALKLNRRGIGIDLSQKYNSIAKARIESSFEYSIGLPLT